MYALSIIRQEYRQTLGLELGQRTDIDISSIISLQWRKGMWPGSHVI